ncbi:monocarboxylate transporter 12-like [Diadema antillarum]|uniref:monocarboxylate transporter 12-like n=1 Tax=Diadema antillarum TaxID=105358 RepID=UPI003A860948
MEDEKSKRRWFVLFGAHVSMLVCAGTYRSCGILLVAWREYFDTTSAEVSGIMSTMACSLLVSGIFTGVLTKLIGCHNVTALGSVIGILGCFGGMFATSHVHLYFTIGIFWGVSVALIYNSSQVVVAYNFKRSHSRANSVASAGVGIGIMVLPPLLQLCINEYGWRGTLLLMSGVQAQLLVAALIFRPPAKKKRQLKSGSISQASKEDEGTAEPLVEVHKPSADSEQADIGEDCLTEAFTRPEKDFNSDLHLCDHSRENTPLAVTESASVSDTTQTIANNETSCSTAGTTDVHNSQDKSCDVTVHQDFEGESPESKPGANSENSVKEKGSYQVLVHVCNGKNMTTSTLVSHNQNAGNSNGDLSHQDSACREDSPLSHAKEDGQLQWELTDPRGDGQSDSSSLQASAEQTSFCCRYLQTAGWTLCRDSIGFTLFSICQVMIGICYTAITAHLVASAVDDGMEEQRASFLLSVFGIASLLGRLANGWLVDLKVISSVHLYIVSMAVLGGSAILSRATSAYGWYMFVSILLGSSSGIVKCLAPVVVKEFVGLENLSAGLGIILIFTGIGDLIGPVLAGALYDATGNYDVPFSVTGAILLLSASLLLFEPPLRRWRQRCAPTGNLELGNVERGNPTREEGEDSSHRGKGNLTAMSYAAVSTTEL